MKKTFNINLAGYGFVIDEDAYEMLHSYLSTLVEICDKAGESETAADIELRIAEIFTEKFNSAGLRIITLADVEEVIARMGMPEDIVEVEAAPQEQVTVEVEEPASQPLGGMPVRKRLYRDVDDRVLGGVCSGIGWYFGIDPVWVRVIAVAGAFLSASTLFLVYVILWIVIPPARTPYERMKMMGIDPSVKNVGEVVKEEYVKRRDVATGVGNVLLLIVVTLGLLIVGSLLLGGLVAFIGCLIALFVSLAGGLTDSSMAGARLVFGIVMGSSLIVGLPLFLLFRALLGLLTGRRPASLSSAQNIILLAGWLLGVAAVITCGCLL